MLSSCLTCSSDRTSSRLRATLRITSVLAFDKLFSTGPVLSFCATLGTRRLDCSKPLQRNIIYRICAVVVLVSALNAVQQCLSWVRTCLHPPVHVRHEMSELSLVVVASPISWEEVVDPIWLWSCPCCHYLQCCGDAVQHVQSAIDCTIEHSANLL